jgi:hypothetical protein
MSAREVEGDSRGFEARAFHFGTNDVASYIAKICCARE